MAKNRGTLTLAALVLAQFMGTSLWFAGNAAAPELEQLLGQSGLVPWITSAVQLGFIVGTFFYAVFQLADRYSPSRVFLWSSLAAGVVNSALLLGPLQLDWILKPMVAISQTLILLSIVDPKVAITFLLVPRIQNVMNAFG